MPPNPHPLIVHFPIALLTLSVFFEILARWSGRESLRSAAFWNLIFGVVFTAVAVASGLFAEEIVPKGGAAHEAMESHESLAFTTLSIFAGLFVWRVVRGGEFYRKFPTLFMAALLLAWATLVATGFYGSELVYRYGVAAPPLRETNGD